MPDAPMVAKVVASAGHRRRSVAQSGLDVTAANAHLIGTRVWAATASVPPGRLTAS